MFFYIKEKQKCRKEEERKGRGEEKKEKHRKILTRYEPLTRGLTWFDSNKKN